ncbi:uncharacterized protein BDFB_002538 [Asbolus verrucosus]|uniref:ASC domain containing protein n=1 Tax=Asbolus verrucosus TaxID=1661398 RepID=A0A482VLH4_ASBVE|nr:uncharacterized protein BDFB_002538 [Asbolus verrucosus]
MAFVRLKKCLTDPKHLVKLVLLVICVCITIYQAKCVNKVLHPPISSYYKFQLNETVKYPSITICRKPTYKTHLFPLFGLKETLPLVSNGFFNNFTFHNSTIEEFLTNTTYTFKETIPLYGYKGQGFGKNVRIDKIFLLDKGLCHTITPTENSDVFSVKGGFFFYFRHTEKEKTYDNYGVCTSGFEIFIHSENQVLSPFGNEFTEYLYVETSEDLQVTLTLESYSQIPTSQNPCISDPDYSRAECREKCFNNFVVSEAGCTLPWLRNLDKVYPTCSDYESVNKFLRAYTYDAVKEDILKHCVCRYSCNNTIYKYHIGSRKEADKIMGMSSTINIFFSSNLVPIVSEVTSYDWNIFLADVGGSLGFLLGLSVIGVITVIEEVIKLIFRTTDNKGIDEKNTQVQKCLEGNNLKDVMEYMVNREMREHEVQKKMTETIKF